MSQSVMRSLTVDERAEWIAQGCTCYRCTRDATHVRVPLNGIGLHACDRHAAMIEHNAAAQAAGLPTLPADAFEPA